LERMAQEAPKFQYRSALARDMGADEAWMDNDSHTLTAKEAVLDAAFGGNGRARFTLAHELGHYFLGHTGRRRRNPDKEVYAGAKERNQESEADLFASFFLVPTDLAMNAKNSEEISNRFQVSLKAAEIAFERIQAAKRRLSGEKRQSPGIVIDFLKEAKLRGLPIRSELPED
ncbi:MAG: ImmA/IrrE family metallo-endopeptidase, partial [Nitratireductor sp.]